MTGYEVLSRYGTGALLKVAALAFLVLALRLVALPFVVVTLLLDRAADALNVAVSKVPKLPAEPLRVVHVSGGARC